MGNFTLTKEQILAARLDAANSSYCREYEKEGVKCGDLPRCKWCHREPEHSFQWFDWALAMLGIPIHEIVVEEDEICECCGGAKEIPIITRVSCPCCKEEKIIKKEGDLDSFDV